MDIPRILLAAGASGSGKTLIAGTGQSKNESGIF